MDMYEGLSLTEIVGGKSHIGRFSDSSSLFVFCLRGVIYRGRGFFFFFFFYSQLTSHSSSDMAGGVLLTYVCLCTCRCRCMNKERSSVSCLVAYLIGKVTAGGSAHSTDDPPPFFSFDKVELPYQHDSIYTQ